MALLAMPSTAFAIAPGLGGGGLQLTSGSSSSGGGGDTLTSPGGTLTIGGTSTNTTVDVASGAVFNGSGITSLNASNVSSGTLAVAHGGTGAAQAGPLNFFSPQTTLSTASATFHNTLFITCNYQQAWTIQADFELSIHTADAANGSDVCVYSLPSAWIASAQTATLVTDTGPTNWPSTGLQKFAPLQNAGCTALNTPSLLCSGSGTGTLPALPIVEPAGYYCAAVTSASTTATINESNFSSVTFLETNSIATTSGQCPATLSSVSPTIQNIATQINGLIGF